MHISKKLTIGLVACGLALVGVGTTIAAEHEEHEGKEQKVALKDCPPAVQQSIQAQAGDGKVTKVEKYTEDGSVVYEAKVKKANGDRVEIKVAGDGKVLSNQADDDDDDDKSGNKQKDDDDDDDKKPNKK